MKLTKIHIEEFKRLKDLEIPIEQVNLLIGGNNSGKSSVLQAIHFAITCLRSARQYRKGNKQPATTLGVNQFSFLPTTEIMSIRHRIPMTQSAGPKFTFYFEDETGAAKSYKLELTRGKNANVALKFRGNTPFFQQASDLRRPFSIYVPGLAGLSLLEERRANAVVTSGIAQGDANLYLRNLLFRIHQSPEKRGRLTSIIRNIFPDAEVTTNFDEDTTQHISAYITLQKMCSPLELAGTGALQALQLAAYVVLYEPKLLLLDEPDAHLHPGNQKQLVDLIFEIASKTETAVIMASHSRHVLDRVESNTLGTVVWLREGKIQSTENADLPLLLDIGALDNFEEISKPHVKNLFFTEDGLTNKLKLLLESSGLNLNHVQIIPFNGADNLSACSTVVDFFLSLGNNRRAVIYRDGDGLTENEKNWLRGKAANALPANTTYLVGSLTDIEHYFCRPAHVASIYGISEEDAKAAIATALQQNQAWLCGKLINKRNDLKFKGLKGCEVWTSTDSLTENGIEFEFAYGKALVGKILAELHERGFPARDLYQVSDKLKHQDFMDLFGD